MTWQVVYLRAPNENFWIRPSWERSQKQLEYNFSDTYTQTAVAMQRKSGRNSIIMNVRFGYAFQVSKVLSRSNSSTSFVLSMNLYKDKSYSEEFEANDFPMTLGLNEPLYIEIKVESPDDRLSVLAEHCYATPNQNPLDKITYTVIQKG